MPDLVPVTAPPTDPAPEAAKASEDLPEGVLARITKGMALAITTVAGVAMAEAAYNLGRFVYLILSLPLPLAVGFPAIFEASAASFAIQDMRDRRAGHASPAMRAATYLTLIASAAVNGIVGFATHARAGLIEVLPPLVLAAVIHLHGDRATRAHQSQAVLRPSWQRAQVEKAQRESVLDVLPLLAGDDTDGRATVELLRRRLESRTLAPGDALIAAGWHDREQRLQELSPGQLSARRRRLETIAATVWGPLGPPVLLPAPATTSRTRAGSPSRTTGTRRGTADGTSRGTSRDRQRTSTGTSTAAPGSGSGTTLDRTSGTGSAPARTVKDLRARTFEDLVGELEGALRAGRLSARSSPRAIRDELSTNAARGDALHAHLQKIGQISA